MNKDELGRHGEELAARHLEQSGLVLLARNWRCGEGEIDLIATDGIGRLVICEVKTRSGTGFGSPAEAVNRAKRRKLRRLANIYLSGSVSRWVSVRFDVISILCRSDDTPEITHLRSAF